MNGKLTSLGVRALTKPGRYADGNGLYLVIAPALTRSWVLRMQHRRKRHDIGLGSAKQTTLAEARRRALEARQALLAGQTPQASWKASRELSGDSPSFEEAANRCHSALKLKWENSKHRDQWMNTLRDYAFPALGGVPVAEVDSAAIMKVLTPIWHSKPETARRVKQRIGAVLDWSHASGLRDTEAPMRSITRGLGSQRAVKSNFAAMPYDELPSFVAKLDAKRTVGGEALWFLIHTAARSSEVRGATWSEIDLKEKVWRISATRMKARKPHTVPLPYQVVDMLNHWKKGRRGDSNDLIFPGSGGRMLSDMTMTKVLRTNYGRSATVHGFRSAFRDWCAEKRSAPDAVAEAALAHTNPNKVERAYRRTDYLDQRKHLMDSWAKFLRPKHFVSRPELG